MGSAWPAVDLAKMGCQPLTVYAHSVRWDRGLTFETKLASWSTEDFS